eukprot:5087192-Prymnesium_polylepis.2
MRMSDDEACCAEAFSDTEKALGSMGLGSWWSTGIRSMSHAVKATPCCTPTVELCSGAAVTADGVQGSGGTMRPQVMKLVCACTESATSSSSSLWTDSIEECTAIVSVSTYGAARSRSPAAERTSGTRTSVLPARTAPTPASSGGSSSHGAPSRSVRRCGTTDELSTLQLAGFWASFPLVYSVTLIARSI